MFTARHLLILAAVILIAAPALAAPQYGLANVKPTAVGGFRETIQVWFRDSETWAVSGALKLYACGIVKTYSLPERVVVANQTEVWNISISIDCDKDDYTLLQLTLKLRNLTSDEVTETEMWKWGTFIRGSENVNLEAQLNSTKAALEQTMDALAQCQAEKGNVQLLMQNLSACYGRIEYLQSLIDSYAKENSRLNSIIATVVEESGRVKDQLMKCQASLNFTWSQLSSCRASRDYYEKLYANCKRDKDLSDAINSFMVLVVFLVASASIIMFLLWRRRIKQCMSLNSSP